MLHFDNFERLILPTNSCPIDVDSKSRGGIRIRMEEQSFDIEIKHANGDVTYKSCNRQHLLEPNYKPYFGIVASNLNLNKNDIDINAVFVTNMDPRVYTDPKELEDEKIHLLLKRHGKVGNDGVVHAHDIISMQIHEKVK